VVKEEKKVVIIIIIRILTHTPDRSVGSVGEGGREGGTFGHPKVVADP